MKFLALSIEISGIPQRIQPPTGVPSGGLLSGGPNILQVALNLLFLFAILLALFMIIFSGIQWITSSGDKQKVAAARNRLTYSLIGLLIIAFSFVIINTILDLLGYNPRFFFFDFSEKFPSV